MGKNTDTTQPPSPQKPLSQTLANLETKPVAAPLQTTLPAQTPVPVELLRLLRNPQSNQLVVEITGQQYTKLADVTDKKIGKFILQVTAHLLAFTNGVIVTDAGMKSVYKPRVGEVPPPIEPPNDSVSLSIRPPVTPSKAEANPPNPSPMIPKPPPEAEAAFLASIQEAPPIPLNITPKKRGLLGRVTQPDPPPANIPGLNLAEEINDIVQARLRYSPLAATNHIEITTDLSGRIRIEVNDKFYSSPDDISDPEIKALIQASIKEWERR